MFFFLECLIIVCRQLRHYSTYKLGCMVTSALLLAAAKIDHKGSMGVFCCHPPGKRMEHLAHVLALNLREVGFKSQLATSSTSGDCGYGVSWPKEVVWFGTARGWEETVSPQGHPRPPVRPCGRAAPVPPCLVQDHLW